MMYQTPFLRPLFGATMHQLVLAANQLWDFATTTEDVPELPFSLTSSCTEPTDMPFVEKLQSILIVRSKPFAVALCPRHKGYFVECSPYCTANNCALE